MSLAAIGDTPYNIILLVHIFTSMAAIAPVFVMTWLRGSVMSSLHSFVSLVRRGKVPSWLRDQASAASQTGYHQRLGLVMVVKTRLLYGPALILSGLLGFSLAGMSDSIYSLSQDWLLAAAILWLLMNGVLHAVMVPAFKLMSVGKFTAAINTRLQRGTALMTILFIAQLWIMIWKPGA